MKETEVHWTVPFIQDSRADKPDHGVNIRERVMLSQKKA
jgi:hypothetical protein